MALTGHNSAREVLGPHETTALGGSELNKTIEGISTTNPTLGRFIRDDILGSVASNSIIDYREWNTLALSNLIVQGNSSDQILVHLKGAMRHGASETEIRDLVTQASIYGGISHAISAMNRIQPYLSTPLQQERLIWLGDHHTMVRDTNPDSKSVPMILIHALCLDGRMWEKVVPQATSAAERIITYDLRGHGYSRGAPLVKDLNHLADDLHLLMTTLDIKEADIHGQSYGGAVAQYFALRYPDRVRSMGLITTAASAQREKWIARATRAREHGLASLIPETIIRWFSAETIASNNWAVRYARMCVERALLDDWASAWYSMAGLDCVDTAHQFKKPVLVVCGKQDLSTGPEHMKAAAKVWNAEYKELDPGTHMMALEQPEALVKELVAFRHKLDQS